MSTQKKLAIVVSSFSALLESDLKDYEDIYLTPLQLFIESNQWFDGFYSEKVKYEIVDKFKKSNDFKTSLAPIVMIEEQMEELSKKYDDVLYLPISSTLSSSHDSIMTISKKYKNVHVCDSSLVGKWFIYAAKEAKRMYEKDNQSIDEIFKFIKWYNSLTIGFIVPFELKTFIKSGRLKGIKKAVLTKLNLTTIIEWHLKLTSLGVTRSKKLGTSKIMMKFDEFIQKNKMKIEDFISATIYTYDKKIEEELNKAFKEHYKKSVDESYEGSLSTMFHTGWGASYIGISPKIELSPFKKK